MGNKILRPTELQPFAGFNDDQISYLKDKFDLLCDENQLLSVEKISTELHTTPEQASKILNYVDFEGRQSVDFYEFVCAAASLHQNDAEALQFIFQIYASGKEMDEYCFNLLFGTVFRYLKFLNLIEDSFSSDVSSAKFKQYDYNKNGTIGFDEFESMLKNDFHCRLWMETLGFAEETPQEVKEKVENHEIENSDEFGMVEEKGEQFMATNAWVKVCEQMCPLANKNDLPEDKTPNVNLDIGYVYGYRSYDTRDNVRYNSQGEIVYHTAACGIVLNKSKNTMRVNTSHNDDITCLDANLSKGLVATGEMGRWPSLVIWDSNTLETKAVFAKKLERNISNVSISKSGRYVAASSMNDKHEIAVYDIAKNTLIAYGQGPKSVIFAIKFNQSEDEIVCACDKEVVFCRFSSGKIENKKGVFGKAPLNPSLAIALAGDSVITSMTSGLLVQWRGNFVSKVYKEHSKSVGALCQRSEGGIISGDAAGNIILWSSNMSKQRQISLEKLLGQVKSNNIRLISLCEQNNNILAGTRGGQIIEVTKYTNANIVMQGHFDKQLWGLTTSYSKNEFFTGGQDKLLIKWDANKRKIISKKKLEYPIHCLDVNRQNLLAVGLTNGIVNLYDGNSMNYIKKIADHKNPDKEVISAIKFSPDGTVLAVAYCPPISRVYLYDIKAEKIKKIGECKGASCRIVSIDFSMGGESLLATSIEPLFYKTANGSQITAVSSLKGEQWSTMNSKYTWYSQGIWPPCSDGSDINSVDRSNSKKYFVSADDFSKVKVFRYPVCNKRQLYNEYKGHSSHVTGVKWSYDDKNLISIGGLQKSIIQWTVTEYPDYNYEIEQKPEVEEEKPEEEEQYEFGNENQKEEGEIGLEEDDGDQALAVKAFLGQVKASTPLNYRPTHSNEPPAQDLKIDHVWGIRNLYINDKVRNQLKYSADGNSCLFITAALGVQMDFKSKRQTFYQGQSDDLISFAITKDRRFCATGQMAELNHNKPTDKIVDVHVWDANTKQLKAKLSRFHKRAVVLVQFSPSGKKLLTVGQDDKNTLAVYDWEIGRVAWSSPVDGAKVTGAAWKNESQYMTVGLKHVKLWTEGKGAMGKIPGKWDPMLSVAYWNDKFVTGGASGSIYVWSGNTGNPNKAHEGTVDALGVDTKGNLYSGCSKGQIILWKFTGGKLIIDKRLYDMSKIDSVDSGVLSFDFFKDNMLVCSNSSSIYQLPINGKAEDTQPLMTSHYKGELWAESWSPDRQRFVTGGDDKTIRIFEAKSYKQLHLYKMKDQIRGIDWQPSQGEVIVVGDYKGKIYLFDTELNLLSDIRTKFNKTKPRQQPFWIEDIKFSPNGKYVAFGAHGGCSHVEVYEIQNKKISPKPTIINPGMTSALLSIDWSQGSDLLVATSQAYQLKFMNLSKDVSASSCRDVKWATWSAKFGFAVQQIHQDVDYSNINCVCINPTRSLVATGGDDQKIRLFTYPVTIPKQKNKEFIGHSSHVTKVRFSIDEKYLLSVGGNDRTIILWNVIGNEPKEEEEVEEEQGEQEEEVDEEALEDAEDIDDFPRAKPQKAKPEKAKTEATDFQMEQDAGDEFMAVKPWLGAIKQPSKPYYKSTGKAPKVEFQLQYAHGYRTKDCRNNLKYLSENEVSYHTAGLGIVMKIDESPRPQTFFDSHTDDIISMAWNEQKTEMFTGQMGAKPIVYRWNKDGEMIKSYKGVKKGVSALAVNSTYLVASGLDDDHYIYVFDIEKGALVASEKGGRDVIIAMKWVGQTNFVSVGVKHYKFWELNGKTVKAKSGSFGKNCNILCSVEVQQSKIFTGASDGSILQWGGNSCTKSQKAHSGAINALCLHKGILLTGSNDQTIKLFHSQSLELINTIECKKFFDQSVNCSIRAIDVHENKIIVGTLGSEIYELKSNQAIENANKDGEFRLVGNYMNGHFSPNFVTNQVWGLSVYDESHYVSCSDDGTLRLWDVEKRQQVTWVDLKFNEKLKPLPQKEKEKFLPDSVKGRCLAVSEDGQVVIGCKDGTIRILDEKLKPTLCSRISQKQISHIKFSPDGALLAIGSHDCKIYIFTWNNGSIKPKSKSIHHNSYIKHFDFSRDSNFLHSTCGAYELLFWDVNTGKQITSGATLTRDEEWASWNVTLGWPVQGIWQPFMDGTDINAIDRTKIPNGNGMRIIATGDDHGHVRLLEYPCIVKNSQSVMGRGHSSHVTNVLFNKSDELLLSTGGEDQTVLQWRIHLQN